ncbi:FMN-dependent NADH-azoreductase [Vallitalea okinawensis]|uniref:FMN-dependent NADH-azoreductase n=1 Tax=Vallitalea okinawensis TaxID=2078660 RepID=UPI0013008FA2|nr:NAD(P)H-dependent oxidoreductase [Vallitalea okinawensis]
MSKTVLYIAANSKPEELSISKTVARKFINTYKNAYPDDVLEELDLYYAGIPEMKYEYFSERSTLVEGEAFEKLSSEEKINVKKIKDLSDQFVKADKYIIAAPMWSMSFPAILKRYIDCVMINGKTLKINEKEIDPLLDDKPRSLLFIQSSGGVYPFFINWKVNHGYEYIKDITKGIGISHFDKILVQGTAQYENGPDVAIDKAISQFEEVLRTF